MPNTISTHTSPSIPFLLRTVRDLANKKDSPPVFGQSILTIAGEGVTTLGGLTLLTAKKGALGSFVTLVGLGIAGLGFFLQPVIKPDPKEPVISSPPVPEPALEPPLFAPVTPPDSADPSTPQIPTSPKPETLPPKPAPDAITPPTPPFEENLFQGLIKKVDALKTYILEAPLTKSEERDKVTTLLEILRDTTGNTTGLQSGNQLKLREYTLNLLRDIIINSTNDQTIKRSIEAVFKIFTKDTRDKLKAESGIALVLINKEPGGPEKLTKFIPDDSITLDKIIKRLESL